MLPCHKAAKPRPVFTSSSFQVLQQPNLGSLSRTALPCPALPTGPVLRHCPAPVLQAAWPISYLPSLPLLFTASWPGTSLRSQSLPSAQEKSLFPSLPSVLCACGCSGGAMRYSQFSQFSLPPPHPPRSVGMCGYVKK
jgi:hypothetical protein